MATRARRSVASTVPYARSTTESPQTAATAAPSFLRPLNVFGLDHLAPVILAALADEQPLLLIGAHGTAKSALLNRIAAALGFDHRHYNASLISFDDLLGYPVPNAERDGLTYLRTGGDLWDAESVFLDEISRCRPEVQNKLFSIVHERRVQGLPLTRLRFRWAAMNPPKQDDWDGAEEGEETYDGSLPLDAALADRFPYVVVVPQLRDLPRADRLALIARGGADPAPESGQRLAQLIAATRSALAVGDPASEGWMAEYVEALVEPLREAGLAISGRRASYLARNARAVHAATDCAEAPQSLPDCAFLALKWGLPQRAQGRTIPEAKLLAIHRAAVKLAGEPATSPWRQLRRIADPVRRLAMALSFPSGTLDKLELSALLTDVWAGLPVSQRYVLARHLFPRFSTETVVNLPALELIAAPMQKVWQFCRTKEHAVSASRAEVDRWNKLVARVAALSRSDPRDLELGNLLLTLMSVEKEAFDADALIELDREWEALFAPAQSLQEAA